jgi:hypothetical protein
MVPPTTAISIKEFDMATLYGLDLHRDYVHYFLGQGFMVAVQARHF